METYKNLISGQLKKTTNSLSFIKANFWYVTKEISLFNPITPNIKFYKVIMKIPKSRQKFVTTSLNCGVSQNFERHFKSNILETLFSGITINKRFLPLLNSISNKSLIFN